MVRNRMNKKTKSDDKTNQPAMALLHHWNKFFLFMTSPTDPSNLAVLRILFGECHKICKSDLPTLKVWTWDNLGYKLMSSKSGLQISWWIKMTDLSTYSGRIKQYNLLIEKVRAQNGIEKCHIRDASWARNTLNRYFVILLPSWDCFLVHRQV